ncbi:hypothetical protein GPL15_15415 [Clostridium sp. MCC353]|uniref:hypothetical protein n=1 Tax=Clostridium sp. MCC353 TaxID=2592646 RepID=UPI001C00B50C|nr:hypothetical protein [Clostridium sp. MCC353]MBT9777890.1 hypothetical protein [Clostridium sp. MCC353]
MTDKRIGAADNWQINEAGLLQNGIHRRIAGPAGSGILQQLFCARVRGPDRLSSFYAKENT